MGDEPDSTGSKLWTLSAGESDAGTSGARAGVLPRSAAMDDPRLVQAVGVNVDTLDTRAPASMQILVSIVDARVRDAERITSLLTF